MRIPKEYMYIDSETWGRGEDDTILELGGAAPCIAIATYESAAKIGHMANLYDPLGSADFEAFLTSIHETTTDPAKLQAWVSGGSPKIMDAENAAEVEAQHDACEAERTAVLQELGAVG